MSQPPQQPWNAAPSGGSVASGFAGPSMGGGNVFGTPQQQQQQQQQGRPQFGEQPAGMTQPQPQPTQQQPQMYGMNPTPMSGTMMPPQPTGFPSTPTASAASTPFPTPTGYPAGSITRFAPAAAAASNPYNLQPPPPPGAASGSGMSYAQRGAMLQQQQPPAMATGYGTPQGMMPSNVYGGAPSTPQPQPQPTSSLPQTPVQQQPPQQPQPPPQQQQQPQAQPVYAPAPANTAGMSFAQRSAMMRQAQPPQNVYGGGMPSSQPGSMYGSQAPSTPQPGYPSTPGTPQATMPAQPSASMMGQPQMQTPPPQQPPQQQQQVSGGMPQPQGQMQGSMMGQSSQMQQPGMMPSGSYAQRSSAMQPQMNMPPPQQQQQQQQPGMGMPQQGMPGQPGMGMPQGMPGQPGMMSPAPQAPPTPNIYVDPPEVIAQQNRLLTDATRKVQEHAYYMKQAMEKGDLPTVLDRAASMVGELGEHAHAHHNSHLHPPGATGTTTALSPKNYYELHLRALEELPTLEDYLLNLSQGTVTLPQGNPAGMPAPGMATPGMPPAPGMPAPGMNPAMTPGMAPGMMPPGQAPPGPPTPQPTFTMKELYDFVQYCPNVLSRLYLQICAASALIRSGEMGVKWVLKDMIENVKCVQNPVRGLFLRHYLLQAFRDKLPNEAIPMDQVVPYEPIPPPTPAPTGDAPSTYVPTVSPTEKGTVKDSYEFVLANFIEMNKLWVRIQHLPGDGRSKEIRRRREKDRNELRILVGTNLVRLSALDSINSQIYGQVILPTVLDHMVISGDPLAQAYLIDCIVQVFPDEYHIETMPILLAVCPKLRDKVNIRTILQNLMDRLANYLADEELLDEKDSNQVKRSMAQDSFRMINECVQNVYNARGPKLQAKEVIRLQTALLSFSMKCYKGNREQMTLCLDNCVVGLQQARANQALMQEAQYPQNHMVQANTPRTAPQLEPVASRELETLLSIPLEELALGVLTLEHYTDLVGFLPWASRRQVALTMLEAVSKAGSSPKSIGEIEALFAVIAPVLRDEHAPTSPAVDQTSHLMAGLGVSPQPVRYPAAANAHDPRFAQDAALVSKLIHLLEHVDTDVHYEMLTVARKHLQTGGLERTGKAYTALVVCGLKLAQKIVAEATEPAETPKEVESEPKEESKEETEEESAKEDTPKEETVVETVDDDDDEEEVDAKEVKAEAKTEEVAKEEPTEEVSKSAKTIGARKVFTFVQQSIAVLAKAKPETGIKLYLESALTADKLASKKTSDGSPAQDALGPVAYEFVSQSFALYEENSTNSALQSNCILSMIGTLLACRSLSKEDYESLIMKLAQYSAKMLKKPEQCALVMQCAQLFYVVGEDDEIVYSNPQRGLECLQRALKLADACTNTNPANVQLFVDLLDQYLYFFEKKHPLITGAYLTGLVALIQEQCTKLGQFGGMDTSAVGAAKAHFGHTVRYIQKKKDDKDSAERYADVDISSATK